MPIIPAREEAEHYKSVEDVEDADEAICRQIGGPLIQQLLNLLKKEYPRDVRIELRPRYNEITLSKVDDMRTLYSFGYRCPSRKRSGRKGVNIECYIIKTGTVKGRRVSETDNFWYKPSVTKDIDYTALDKTINEILVWIIKILKKL